MDSNVAEDVPRKLDRKRDRPEVSKLSSKTALMPTSCRYIARTTILRKYLREILRWPTRDQERGSCAPSTILLLFTPDAKVVACAHPPRLMFALLLYLVVSSSSSSVAQKPVCVFWGAFGTCSVKGLFGLVLLAQPGKFRRVWIFGVFRLENVVVGVS